MSTLDYAGNAIRMIATSDVEKSKRIVACAKEPETVEFVESIPPGAVFVDVGANTGAYSLIAGSRGVKVYAFEPHLPSYHRLLENIKINQLGRSVSAYPFVLSSTCGPVGFKASSPEPGAALHQVVEGQSNESYTLDRLVEMFVLPQPEFMKVDTDGHELQVLQGADRALHLIEAVQVELDDEHPWSDEIIDFLKSHRLQAFKWTRHGDTSISNVLFRR